MFDFSDKVVVITGGTGNLGQAIIRAFQAAQAKLVLLDRSENNLQKAYPELTSSPNYYFANNTDLTEPDRVATAIAGAIDHFGRIDVLVNAAGGFRAGTPLHETPLDTWDFMLNLNARSVFIICRVVIPHMIEQGRGKIVNVAARAALTGGKNLSAYSVSKSAVMRLTESMAAELGEAGINVNCILPSTIDTPQNREAMPKADFSRWVQPEALAEAILFLASDAARAINGASLPVYGRG
ncbi:MAG: SDR family NAD(P)-dependent oxidoreductase [Anaerolineae bacterium]|nr:SDR family NAD(P)-dependent oxidoreductase [Anaerolineae bacterium]